MNMKHAYLAPVVLLLMMIPQNVAISGKILDWEGKPMANAVVVYSETTKGTVYRLKTDKNGEFSALGIVPGYYKIQITAPDGRRVYTGSRSIGTNQGVDPLTDRTIGDNVPLKTNVLHVDLSTVGPNGEMAVSDSGNKKSAAEINAIRKENAKAIKQNQLIPALHLALDASDWPRATSILQRLIAADSNRWEFYQNLGTIQSHQGQYEEAVESFEKAIALDKKAIGNSPPPEAREFLSGMLIAQADAFDRMGQLTKSLERYAAAAEISPHPAMAHFYACNAQHNSGYLDAAIKECDVAIAADPARWEFYQTKAGAENDLGHPEIALEVYEKGIAAAKAAIEANRDPGKAKSGLGQMLNASGSLYVQQRQYQRALPLFEEAVPVAAYPALIYYNLCAAHYNMNDIEGALAACDKAIASDPEFSDAYFVKASMLFGKGSLHEGRYQAPEGTTQALKKYLELNPQGSHASDAKSMLEKIGTKMDTGSQTHK